MTEPDLEEWARASVDMVPHVEHLKKLASQSQLIVEFGVRTGVSTMALLAGLPRHGRLISVDIDPAVVKIAHPSLFRDHRWMLIIGNDNDADVYEQLFRQPDLLMIDASHTYEDTQAELRIGEALGAKRIALHDYLYGKIEPTCHVKEAVDEFVDRGTYVWEHLYPSQWGLAVLKQR